MNLPEELLQSLQNVEGFHEEAFRKVHAAGEQVTSIRFNPLKWTSTDLSNSGTYRFVVDERVPWSAYGFYIAQRPSFTFDPFFHAGCYYVQEASSMFLEQALQQTTDLSQPLKVLDLCAAPGGKSTHIQSLISKNSLLVSNEVIGSRAGILKQNIVKWGAPNVVVTNNDPKHFSKLKGFFDIIVVDAPCSGSGLFRKDAEAVNEWSPENVLLCCGRQKRIVSDAFASLKQGGLLIYSTCSYSKEEDEDMADWLVEEMKMMNVRLNLMDEWGIIESSSPKTASYGYRFFPDKVKGEGFYLACFRKTTAEDTLKQKPARLETISAKEKSVLQEWIENGDVSVIKEKVLTGLPAWMVNDYSFLRSVLNVHYAGIGIGTVMKDKLVPDHALALSSLLKAEAPRVELGYEDAIRYLQRADISIIPDRKGWQAVSYQHHNLGWINALPNRVNNYYPKELRILKQRDDSAFEK